MTMFRRSLKIIIVALALVSAGIFYWSRLDRDEPVLLGFVAGTTGRVADLGISGRDAVQLSVEQFNDDGGVHGRPVRLLIKDDQQNPETARRVVRELIEAGVAAIIGPMTSDMAVAVVPLLNETRTTAISPTATTQQLSGLDDYFFRITSTADEFARRSARYHLETGDMSRVAAVFDDANRSFSENWLDNFEAAFTKAGGKIIKKIGFRADAGRTFFDIARELTASGPDGILIIANSMDSALFCQQIRKLDPELKITLADWGATERLLELGGQSVEGVTVVQTFDRDSSNPRYQSFRRAYLERYGKEPGFPGVHARDAVTVALDALRARKKGRSLKETVLALRRFKGLQDEFEFDDFGDVNRASVSISVVRGGKFVVLE